MVVRLHRGLFLSWYLMRNWLKENPIISEKPVDEILFREIIYALNAAKYGLLSFEECLKVKKFFAENSNAITKIQFGKMLAPGKEHEFHLKLFKTLNIYLSECALEVAKKIQRETNSKFFTCKS